MNLQNKTQSNVKILLEHGTCLPTALMIRVSPYLLSDPRMGIHWLNSIYIVLLVAKLSILQFECVHALTFSPQISQRRLLVASTSKINVYSNQHGNVPIVSSNNGPSARSIVPQNVTLDVLYEDDDILVIDKPSGMIMQFIPGSVESAVVFYLQNNNNRASSTSTSTWPWKSPESFEGIVHRIDKETSGILVLAKHPTAAIALHASFQERQVHKRYLAIAVGLPTEEKLISLQTASSSTSDNKISPLQLHAQLVTTEQEKLLSKQIKKCGSDADKALELLNQASNPSASNFNSAINICKNAGDRDKALLIFDSMKERGVTPNIKCFLKAINFCSKKPPLDEKAIELVGYMDECGIPLNPNCVSSAISACGHAGQIEPVLELLRLMEADKRSNDISGRVGCFKAAIRACERCGASNSALVLEEQLRIMIRDREGHHENIPRAVDLQSLNKEIVVDAPIGRLGSRRSLMGIQSMDQGGREARSIVSVLAFDGTLSLNSIVIETGRTHQIRVHMASMLGCPLAGDHMYDDDKSIIKGAERCMLHATELTVPHPTTGALLTFCCSPPPDFSALADDIRRTS